MSQPTLRWSARVRQHPRSIAPPHCAVRQAAHPRQSRRALVIAQPHEAVEIEDAGVPTRSGTLKVVKDVYSPELHNTRDILVHLPASYEAAGRRYPVIYMHDGQNLFDDATSFAGAWHVDEALAALDCEDVEAIVVGIPNLGPKRIDEYSPFVDAHRRGGSGDRYLRFIIQTLKPLIDREFRTLPDR